MAIIKGYEFAVPETRPVGLNVTLACLRHTVQYMINILMGTMLKNCILYRCWNFGNADFQVPDIFVVIYSLKVQLPTVK